MKKARADLDDHVEVNGHDDSVPHRLVGAKVEVHASTTTVAIDHRGRVGRSTYAERAGAPTTHPDHMPPSHRAHRQWTPGRFLNWAADIGPATTAVVNHLLSRRPHPEQGYRACLGLLNLEKRDGRQCHYQVDTPHLYRTKTPQLVGGW